MSPAIGDPHGIHVTSALKVRRSNTGCIDISIMNHLFFFKILVIPNLVNFSKL
jgi:hypothetical protein